MKKRICPICDREMKTGKYCKTCHQFVFHPKYIETSYSLNEDSDYKRDQAAWKTARESGGPGRAGAGAPKPGSVQPRTVQPGAAKPGSVRPAAPGGPAKVPHYPNFSGQRWGMSLTGRISLVFVILLLSIGYGLGQAGKSDYSGYSEYSTYAYQPDEEAFLYDDYDDSGEYEAKELTKLEALVYGKRCSGCAHLQLTVNEVLPMIRTRLEQLGYQITDEDEEFYGYEYEYQYAEQNLTYFNSCHTLWMMAEDTEEDYGYYISIEFDTYSKEIHGLDINVPNLADGKAVLAELVAHIDESQGTSDYEEWSVFAERIDQADLQDDTAFFNTPYYCVEASWEEYEGADDYYFWFWVEHNWDEDLEKF